MDKIERIKELTKELNRLTELYDKGTPEISDKEWDDMYFELVNLERECSYIMSDSPTQKVNYTVVNELQKVKHNHPMLSLDKTKDIEEIKSFVNDKDWIAMLKMDGLTCSLLYESGKLMRAETRGDGEVGEDITHNAMVIPSIPKRIPYTDKLIVDGEIICKLDDFEGFSEEYKNARNFASGSIRLLDSKECAKRKLTFVAWDIIEGPTSNSLWGKLTWLSDYSFTVVPFLRGIHCSVENTMCLKQIAQDYNYPIDGIVFKIDNCIEYKKMGRTDHHFRGGLAFKFYNDIYETKLLDIEWTQGKTGILTPTAVFQAVQIDGTDISRASLHNISIIKKLGLTNHCTVKISKRNEIIPQVEECLQDGDSDIEIPKYCPICKGNTKVVKENESEVLMCTNPNCTGKKIALFEHFVSKKAMNIEGISEATIEFLINKGWIHTFKDLYYLSEHKAEWQKCDGFGKRSVEKILDAVEKSRNVKLDNFITALSIDGIGKSTAKAIADFFHYDFLNWYHNGVSQPFDYASFDGIGKTMCDDIQIFCAHNKFMIADLADEMKFIVEEKKQKDGVNLDGKTFCITGSLNHFANRDALIADIEAHNGKFISSISAKCNYLINNDSTSSSSKNKKAQALNIPIITEEEYLQIIKEEEIWS